MNWLEQLRADMQRNQTAAIAKDSVVVDVRGPLEFRMGHVEGAQLLPLTDMMMGKLPQVPSRDTPVVVYCASGGRSAQAQMILQQQGFTHVVNGVNAQAVASALGKTLIME